MGEPYYYGLKREDWGDDLRVTWKQGDSGPVLALPHQCDDWVIGTTKDAQALIADLQRLISEGPGDNLERAW